MESPTGMTPSTRMSALSISCLLLLFRGFSSWTAQGVGGIDRGSRRERPVARRQVRGRWPSRVSGPDAQRVESGQQSWQLRLGVSADANKEIERPAMVAEIDLSPGST